MTKRNEHALRLALAALALTSAVWIADAGAQGRSNGGSTGAAPVGGATSNSNRGGAGGVSNPSPGGEPATVGTPGYSPGPQGTEQSRSGYVGGRTTGTVTPPPPPPPPGTVTPTSTLADYATAQFGKCAYGAHPDPRARLTGDNVGRIDVVAGYLAQGQQANGASARYLVADLQEELEKPKPDATLAGTYLGLASAMPVTPALAADIGASLCAPVSDGAAQEIAAIAETQRRKLSEGR
ncbi:MAG TPA: hypothetical protein VKP89_04450 [Burkholderiales bacterium]|nr:hypothetical protein [Burkholderiales bacterium]